MAPTLLIWGLFSCAATSPNIPERVQDEVRQMAAEDQRWEHLVMDGDPAAREPGFFGRKDELQDRNAARCAAIFERYGLPTPARVGPEVASDFWVLIQHADRNVELQAVVLSAMESSDGWDVDPTERAYLVDRVAVNSGEPQVYGTQVRYDHDTGRAFPKALGEPGSVDQRRDAAGLEPLWLYMNDVSESHFVMNRRVFEDQGIVEPWSYDPGFSDW